MSNKAGNLRRWIALFTIRPLTTWECIVRCASDTVARTNVKSGGIKMKSYITPTLEIVTIEAEDIIATSISVELPWQPLGEGEPEL